MNNMNSYSNLLQKLYRLNVFHKKSVGLSSMHALYRLIGRPLDHIPVLHVAGTNGKGSVAKKIAQAMQAAGLKTGLYTSPHIHSFRERIQVNGRNMSVQEVEVSFSLTETCCYYCILL